MVILRLKLTTVSSEVRIKIDVILWKQLLLLRNPGTRHTRGFTPRWASVAGGGPTLKQHLVNCSCLLGTLFHFQGHDLLNHKGSSCVFLTRKH